MVDGVDDADGGEEYDEMRSAGIFTASPSISSDDKTKEDTNKEGSIKTFHILSQD